MNRDLERESMNELMATSLMDQRLRRADAATVKSVNESGSVQNCSEHDVGQVKVEEKVVTIWLLDTRAVTHVMPKCLWEQLGEPALQTTNVTLRGANGQDLGAVGEVQVRDFIEKRQVQFKTVVARDARRCLLRGRQLRTHGHTFTLSEQGSFLTQSKGGQRVQMTRGGNRETLNMVCFLKPRDTQSGTSLMLKRELDNVRREFRNSQDRAA